MTKRVLELPHEGHIELHRGEDEVTIVNMHTDERVAVPGPDWQVAYADGYGYLYDASGSTKWVSECFSIAPFADGAVHFVSLGCWRDNGEWARAHTERGLDSPSFERVPAVVACVLD